MTPINCRPKGSFPTLAISSTVPPSAAIAAATLVGAPPGFFKKCWPSDKDCPLSVQIISISASPMQSIFFILYSFFNDPLLPASPPLPSPVLRDRHRRQGRQKQQSSRTSNSLSGVLSQYMGINIAETDRLQDHRNNDHPIYDPHIDPVPFFRDGAGWLVFSQQLFISYPFQFNVF